ncbi:MAG: hypothetical protein IPJ03_08965 [Ignavibacteriales bacterium]|nr:hypothetical protein [Ignavibacteriales bacterium]
MRITYLTLISILVLFIGCENDKENNIPVKEKTPVDSIKAKSLIDDYHQFYFVGMIDKVPGIFKYNFENHKTRIVWSKRKEKVIDLSYSHDRNTIFFLTAKEFGIEGTLPFVERVKAYQINTETGTITYVKEIGSGLQVFSRWEVENNYQVVLYSFDRAVSTYVNQNIFLFNSFGKAIMDEIITYDLTKDGYPKPPKVVLNMISPSKKFKLVVAESDYNTFILKDIKTKKDHQVMITSQQISNVAWSSDSKLLFFSTVDISERNRTLKTKNPETSQLVIYSTESKKILKQWNGGGLKRFFIEKNILFFDSGFSNEAELYLYNFKDGEFEETIKLKGGCGLKSVPEILKTIK